MKNRLLFLSLIIFCYSCKQQKESTTIQKQTSAKQEIHTLLNNWHKAASDADFNGYFNKMDSLAIFIGTDASENWSKQEFQDFSKPYFEKGKAWSFTPLERNIYLHKTNDFAWFDELLNTWMGTCRGSGILERTNNSWVLKHYVLSITIPNDDIQAVLLAKKKNDSIFVTKNRKQFSLQTKK